MQLLAGEKKNNKQTNVTESRADTSTDRNPRVQEPTATERAARSWAQLDRAVVSAPLSPLAARLPGEERAGGDTSATARQWASTTRRNEHSFWRRCGPTICALDVPRWRVARVKSNQADRAGAGSVISPIAGERVRRRNSISRPGKQNPRAGRPKEKLHSPHTLHS